jgi:hypothetical protein
MLTQHIALVPEADGVDASELARVSAALQKQVTRDLSPAWGITATVDAFPYLEDVPVGYWPIIVSHGDVGGHAGVHVDRNGQPYALVRAAGGWSLAASRACIEMLINPFENRFATAPSMRSDRAPVEFLVEACAPCEDARHAYTVNGVAVSDFCLPAFFGGKTAQADRYSWNGSVTRPFELPRGGHITWYDPVENSWWLRSHWGENPVDTKIGAVDRKLFSVRELAQACAPLRGLAHNTAAQSAFAGIATEARRASQVRAHRLRSLLGAQLESDLDAAVDALVLPQPAAAIDDEPEIELEASEYDFDYDFDSDEPTLVTPQTAQIAAPRAPAPSAPRAVRKSDEHSARIRSVPPPLRAVATASVSSRPTTLSPISVASMPEPSAPPRSRAVIAGGLALAAGVALALAFGPRSAHPVSAPRAAAASPAAPAPLVAAPAPAPAPPVAPLAPAHEIIPGANAVAPASGSASASDPVSAPAPATEPRKERSIARRVAPRSAPPPPPAPVATIRPRAPSDALDDLIDTRR